MGQPMRSIRKPASMYISLCTFVCILQRVGAHVCARAKGSERGFGWGRSSPRPPGCCCGEPGGGQLAAPGSLSLLGGSGGEVQQFCKQRPLSETPTATSGAGLQRSSVPFCRAGRKQASAGSLSPRGPLQALRRVCPHCATHLPVQLRNTAGAFWRALVNMCTWMQIVRVQSGAGLVLELPPANPQQKPCSWFPLSSSQDQGLSTTGRCERC